MQCSSRSRLEILHRELGLRTKVTDLHEGPMIWTRIQRWMKGSKDTGRPKARPVMYVL